MITSSSNSQIKNLIALQSKSKVRSSQEAFVTEGVKMFAETDPSSIVKVYVSESFYSSMSSKDEAFFKNFEYEIVSDKVLREAADTQTPQGILAIVKQPHYDFEQLICNPKANLILLEDLRDPGNMGTIIRTAEGAGVTGLIISKTSVDIFNPKVVRSTMGALYRVPFVYVEDFQDSLKRIQEENITIYASHLQANKFYDEETYEGKCGIIIGNEANGISEQSSSIANRLIKIPMEGKLESLNASVAAAILMYEVYRQRRNN
jgi:TrmH family RNA methyltransferase